jgi:hypothetical protein
MPKEGDRMVITGNSRYNHHFKVGQIVEFVSTDESDFRLHGLCHDDNQERDQIVWAGDCKLARNSDIIP